ncbi:MAG: heme biosynthesis protein HemY [Proteobacteria bacterium]|nr:heme biosynthesis protein HemY [Pseudomonadota bacterium]
MWRGLKFILVIAIIVNGAVWLADEPGQATVQWRGYRADMSFAVLLSVVAVLAVLAGLALRFWDALKRVPGQVADTWRNRQRGRGYAALSRGMVAVAAGDGDEAKRQSRRADGLLDDAPLTLLLAAQAAQLDGDEGAAGRFFTAMLDNPETEFLGVRGLLTQAMKRDDAPAALTLARRAYRLKPKSEWVATTLFELQARNGQWLDAQITGDDLVRQRLLPAPEGKRRRAALAHQLALQANARGDTAEAARQTAQAFDRDPTFLPAALAHARDLVADGKMRKARRLIEGQWRTTPHPDLVEPYLIAHDAGTAVEQVRHVDALAAINPDHVESRYAQARVNLDARLWGEAREHLAALGAHADAGEHGSTRPDARTCRLMAELEESEHEDAARAREWYRRAAHAEPDPAWVCDNCGNTVEIWTALCANCQTFDGFDWRTPPHVINRSASDVASPGLPMIASTVTEAASERKEELKTPPLLGATGNAKPANARSTGETNPAVTVPAAEG